MYSPYYYYNPYRRCISPYRCYPYPYYYRRYPVYGYYYPYNYPYYPRRRRRKGRLYGMEDEQVFNQWDTPWREMTDELPSEYNHSIGLSERRNNVVYPDYSNVDVGQGISWPDLSFVPTVDATAWPPLTFADDIDQINVPYYNLGFIVSKDQNTCEPTWGTYYSTSEGPLNSQIKKIREMGGDVMVSFGGPINVPLQATAPNASVLKKQYYDFVKAYGLTRIGFDIESTWLRDTASLKRNSEAIKMLQDDLMKEGYDLDVWFILPISPSGLSEDAIAVLRYALDAGVDIGGVCALTMNYGDAVAPEGKTQMAGYGILAITTLKDQLSLLYQAYGISKSDTDLWHMVGTMPMIGLNDVTSEIFTLKNAEETLGFALLKDIGMISIWTLNRDKQCPGGVQNYVSISCSSILQEKYAFSTIFNKFNDLSNFNTGDVPVRIPIDRRSGITYPVWSATETYVKGDKVIHKGKAYEAKWWTKGFDPTTQGVNSWENPWKLLQ